MEQGRARELCEQVLTAMMPILPQGVEVVVQRTARGWNAVRVPGLPDLGAQRVISEIEDAGGIPGPVIRVCVQRALRLGTWIPLLPAKLRARLNLISAVELIRDTVTGDPPCEDWPLPGARINTRVQAGRVFAWFEAPDGTRIEIGVFPLSSCL